MTRLARFAWITLAVNIVTIIGGMIVRSTGSGAGCGRHWPQCQGEIVPGFTEFETIVEFSHRMVSGLALLTVMTLIVWVFRSQPKGSQRRKAAFTAGVAIIIESLLGAWLVLAELVADDASVARAISVPVHLVNTFFLLAALTTTAWLLTRDGRHFNWRGPDRRMLSIGMVGLLLIGASGAVTALAGTLFPSESFAEGFARDFEATSHFLTRLRILHPIVAILSGVYLMTQAQKRKGEHPRIATAITSLVVVQWGVGFLNVVALTPLVAQIIHLLLADLLLVAWVLFGAELLQDADDRDSVEV